MTQNIPLMPKNPMFSYAYIAYQPFDNLYNANEALYHGTIFKDLDIPFSSYRNNPIMNPFK
ncbi:MAG: spore coat associated protein CotJA [Clostridia bacterium]|nr:spore coat associated protein CotJA [Oscillospiraceae bacterium]MDY5627134.1 spore coat associated protein CotJA [Clostridia bacterium]